jgi:uncharacterized protein YpbB
MDVQEEPTIIYLLASHLLKKLIQILSREREISLELFVQKIVTPSYLQQVTTKTFTPLIEGFSKLASHNRLTENFSPTLSLDVGPSTLDI